MTKHIIASRVSEKLLNFVIVFFFFGEQFRVRLTTIESKVLKVEYNL